MKEGGGSGWKDMNTLCTEETLFMCVLVGEKIKMYYYSPWKIRGFLGNP
jgi:hypothetical protein